MTLALIVFFALETRLASRPSDMRLLELLSTIAHGPWGRQICELLCISN